MEADEINNAQLASYYPFVGRKGENKIYFSVRYLWLIVNYLYSISLHANIMTERAVNTRGLETNEMELPEYNDNAIVNIEIPNPLNTSYLYSHDHEIYINDTITLLDLYRELCAAYHAQNWYDQIIEYTPRSILIDLSKSDIEQLLKGKTVKEAEINAAIAEIGKLAFVRLYSLSPKSDCTTSFDLTATNAAEVCKMIRLSERTSSTLGLYRREGIMLREFIADMDLDNEFRLFVFDDKLRAISQYNCYNHIDKYEDVNVQNEIYKRICEFFDEISDDVSRHAHPSSDCLPALGLVDYVIDVEIDMVHNRNLVIEINCFGPGLLAGSGLFNWITDYDVMHYSDKPVIRFNTIKSV